MKKSKLKVNKNFIPCPVSPDDEIYANGIFKFNITRMLEYIDEKPGDFQVEEVSVAFLSTGFSHINESHVASVDISKPVILAEIAPERYNLIDGNHRVEKARRMGVESIAAYRLTVDRHINFLIDKNAYLSYVEYWNGKIKGYSKMR